MTHNATPRWRYWANMAASALATVVYGVVGYRLARS